ncbi:MAG: carboxylesterase family protein [Gammaproteobacteria bacterium]|nr:carboxylesterase family protein [Gammaproteobacteria bacterium]
MMRGRLPTASLAVAAILSGCGGGGDSGDTVAATTLYVPWPTPFYAVTAETDIVYGQGEINGGGEWQDLTLDLYRPDEWSSNPNKKFPLLLMIHGGGFTRGSKENANLVGYALEYAQRGWLVAAINYRLVDDDPVPSSRMQSLYEHVGNGDISLYNRTVVAAIDDTLTAIEFLQMRNDVYTPWTSVWGISAGGVVALNGTYVLDDHGIARPDIAAAITVSGHFGANGAYLGGTPFDDPAGTDPPLLIIHGTADSNFELAQSAAVLAAEAPLIFDFQQVADGGHVLDLQTLNSDTGVPLLQHSVDYLLETVFSGYESGPATAPMTD